MRSTCKSIPWSSVTRTDSNEIQQNYLNTETTDWLLAEWKFPQQVHVLNLRLGHIPAVATQMKKSAKDTVDLEGYKWEPFDKPKAGRQYVYYKVERTNFERLLA